MSALPEWPEKRFRPLRLFALLLRGLGGVLWCVAIVALVGSMFEPSGPGTFIESHGGRPGVALGCLGLAILGLLCLAPGEAIGVLLSFEENSRYQTELLRHLAMRDARATDSDTSA